MFTRAAVRVALSLLFVGHAISGVAAEEPVPEVQKPDPELAAKLVLIENWVRQLDSDSYPKREEATRQLVKAGKPAVEPLVDAALGDNLEVTSRVVKILVELYKSEETDAVDAAETGLERLLASERGSVLQRVESVFSANSALRQQRAVAAIKRLGGRIKFNNDPLEEEDKNLAARAAPATIAHVILNGEWKGGDRGLMYIKRLSNLQTLYVTNRAPVSPDALQELVKASENRLKIQERGDACLGVKSMVLNPGEACQVSQVEKDSAAEKAGLKDGDFILKFDGKKVADFNEMVEIIKAKAPGDEVEIEILRNSETLTKKAILEQWR